MDTDSFCGRLKLPRKEMYASSSLPTHLRFQALEEITDLETSLVGFSHVPLAL
jgi:hypothetical protein